MREGRGDEGGEGRGGEMREIKDEGDGVKEERGREREEGRRWRGRGRLQKARAW